MQTIETLTSEVALRSVRLSKLLAAKSHPDPTFAANSYSRYVGEDVELRTARQELVRAAQNLASLAQSPEDHILSLAWSSADTTNLAVLLRFNLPQLVPPVVGITAPELAAKARLPEDVVTRMMRYAIANGIFTEGPELGTFRHNASSALLARNEHLRDIALTGTRELSYCLLRLGDALELQQQELGTKGAGGSNKQGALVPPPMAAFNLVYPEHHNVFEFLSKDPGAAGRYHKYMVGRHNTSRWTIGHMIGAYDWKSTANKTIVDAGGSSGHTVLALSHACPPSTRFIVQDVDPVALDQGRAFIKSLTGSGKETDRFDFQVHDLFKPQPVSADIFVFRHVFHDWSDGDTVKMVKNLVPALNDGAVVLVSEGIVPEQPAERANTLDEKQILVEDIFMMAIHGARERTVADFVRLFNEADPRLTYVGTTGGKDGAFQSLLEFKFESGGLNGVTGQANGVDRPVMINGYQ